jgi:hypothetical protein
MYLGLRALGTQAARESGSSGVRELGSQGACGEAGRSDAEFEDKALQGTAGCGFARVCTFHL